jgi:hypothetical protein
VKLGYITAQRPLDVAREVEVMLRDGYTKFIVRHSGHSEMLDRERLGAARYAAGRQAEVELEGQSSPVASSVSVAGAGAR